MSKLKRTALDQIEFMRNVLAFILVGSFITIGGALLWVEVPEKNEQLLSYMLGQISGMALMALGFYFVSKVGQDALDATRSENTGKMADAVQTALKASKTGNGEHIEDVVEEVADAAVGKANEIKER